MDMAFPQTLTDMAIETLAFGNQPQILRCSLEMFFLGEINITAPLIVVIAINL